MEQAEMNNMYINIDVNNGSEKCTDKTLRRNWLYMYEYIQRSPTEIQTRTHWNLIGDMTTPPTVLSAQYYSSASYAPLRFHFRKKNPARVSNMLLLQTVLHTFFFKQPKCEIK